MNRNVHVHLSEKNPIKWGHLLSWYIPQLKSKDNNKLILLNEEIGLVTNDVETITQDSKVILSTTFYNVVIVLDMSASMFTVDMDHKKVIIEELNEAIEKCIVSLCKHNIHPWNDKGCNLDITLSVVAYTPQFKDRFFHVLVQGYPLVPENCDDLIKKLDKKCTTMHNFIKTRSTSKIPNSSDEFYKDYNQKNGFFNLLLEVLKILQVQRSNPVLVGLELADDPKNVIIMITDGVVGQTHKSTDIVKRLHVLHASCSFIRVGACDPINYGFGYMPNISLLEFIAQASGGQYWNWGENNMEIEKVLHWSPFCGSFDNRGLIMRSCFENSKNPIIVSITSTITKKLHEGFKISSLSVTSEIQEMSGVEVTTLHVTLRYMWRKRIQVFYEVSTQLPIEQGAQKVKVSVSVWANYDIIQNLENPEQNFDCYSNIKHLNEFLSELQDNTSDRWTSQLHSYAAFSINKLIPPSEHKNKPYKIENTLPTNVDEKKKTLNDFWRRLVDEKQFINANFDVYLLKCWLQFDLTLPKCLTGTRPRNRNKESQIYSRSRGFLLDVLEKWSTIVIGSDKDTYIKLLEIEDPDVPYKNSFVWVRVSWVHNNQMYSFPKISFFIAMHRDIPFAEQKKIRENLVNKLLNVKFQGTQLLDSSIKVGLDTTLKKRGGNFLPFKLDADFACQELSKNMEDVIMWCEPKKSSNKFYDLYLHRLICNWKTCPDIQCCSDELIKELRNEIFNSLFRLRLQENYKPITVSCKELSFYNLFHMDNPNANEEAAARGQMCLIQYRIKVDDEITSENKAKEQRKISSNFTTEIWVEPQWGVVNTPEKMTNYLHGLQFNRIPPKIFELDFKLINSLCTFATLKKLCLQPDKAQPEFSDLFCPKPTSFREPVLSPKLPYLFLLSTLLDKSLLNVMNIELIKVIPNKVIPNKEINAEDCIPGTTCSPSSQLINVLCEQLQSFNKRQITLSSDEVKTIQNMILARSADRSHNVNFSSKIPDWAWKCFVRFHKRGETEDLTRLHFTILPQPPSNFTEKELLAWFPDHTLDIFVFDCFYKILLGTFTNSQKCSEEILHGCDRYLQNIEDLNELECPQNITDILEHAENSSHTTPTLDKTLKCKYVSSVGEAFEKSYIFGVHSALQHSVRIEKRCVDKAISFLNKPQSNYIKKETKQISLSRYLSAVCSHLSGQRTCCTVDGETMNTSIDSSELDPSSMANSECYSADIDNDMTHDTSPDNLSPDGNIPGLLQLHQADNGPSSVCMFPGLDGGAQSTADLSDSDSYQNTPLQSDAQNWSAVSHTLHLHSSTVDSEDHYTGEIVSASSAELTPIMANRRFEDDIAHYTKYNESNVDIDNDSDSSSTGPASLATRPATLAISQSQSPDYSSLTGLSTCLEEPDLEKKVSFASIGETPCRSGSMDVTSDSVSDPPIIQVISSTPIVDEILTPTSSPSYTEKHLSIQRKFESILFDDVLERSFMSIHQYTEEYIILKPGPQVVDLDSTCPEEVNSPLFLKVTCKSLSNNEVVRTLATLPTCVLQICGTEDKKCKDIELCFTLLTMPSIPPPPASAITSPVHTYTTPRVLHRRKDSYNKDRSKSEHPARTASNLDDTDENAGVYPSTSNKSNSNYSRRSVSASRDLQLPNNSTPSLIRHDSITDPIVDYHSRILADLFRHVEWLIEDQYINNLRKRTPVTIDVLKQVMLHCQRKPAKVANCTVRSEKLCYVDSWPVRDKEDKTRYEQLLTKIQFEQNFELFRLCRINNYFYYTLLEENEPQDLSGREALSAHSSISSVGSATRSYHYHSSSSSLAEELPFSSLKMKPCSSYWIVVHVLHDKFHVALQTVDKGTGAEQLDEETLNVIIDKICYLNKVQNQEFLLGILFQLYKEQKQQCPKELLYNPNHQGNPEVNKYVCDVVHTIEVLLWDTEEEEGLEVIKETLMNLVSTNSDNPVYFYPLASGPTNQHPAVVDLEEHSEEGVASENKHDMRSTFYFQLPKPKGGTKPKFIHIEVRGLRKPDPVKQQHMDMYVRQKLEDKKLEDIAHRLNRNSQTKLTSEEVAFLSNKNDKSDKTVYCKVPEYVQSFLPHFWFYLDQHLQVQLQHTSSPHSTNNKPNKLFNPKYFDNNKSRIQFRNEKTGEMEVTQDNELYINLKFGNSIREFPHRGGPLHREPLFQSLQLVNITLVDDEDQRVDYSKRPFKRKSPVFNAMLENYEPPSARENKDIIFTPDIDGSSEISLKLRMIEKRKKGGRANHLRDFEGFLYQSVQAAYISLLLEVYILPADLILPAPPKPSVIVGVNDEDIVVARATSSSLGKPASLLNKLKNRRNSNESLEVMEREKLRKKSGHSTPKEENSTLHPILRDPCLEACRIGAQMKTKIVEHLAIQLPSLFIADQVINKVIDGLTQPNKQSGDMPTKCGFKVRIFRHDKVTGEKYKMLPPKFSPHYRSTHTVGEIENHTIFVVARHTKGAWIDSRHKLQGGDMCKLEEKVNIELGVLAMETGAIDVASEKLQIPRQMHIVITLDRKKLKMWFYNIHNEIRQPFVTSITSLVKWLSSRYTLLTRILLFKARHETPDLSHYAPERLPQTDIQLTNFMKQAEPPVIDQENQQHSSFKNNIIDSYEQLYEVCHPGLVTVDKSEKMTHEPLKRHCNQLRAFMRASQKKKEDLENQVNLGDPDVNKITRDQAKLLKQNARLLHYVASPLLFSSKIKPFQSDKETFSYLSPSAGEVAVQEPVWFLHFKKQLFNRFISYLKNSANIGGVHMNLAYEPGGDSNDDVEVPNMYNSDDKEALLWKDARETQGGKILLGFIMQNSTICVKLYTFDSDNRSDCMKLFQECLNLKTQTHTNSFNYDWMVHSIYESILPNKDCCGLANEKIPVHMCVESVVSHYEKIGEPPHIRCWIKHYKDLVYKREEKYYIPQFKPENLFDYIVDNKDDLGMRLIVVDSKKQENRKLIALIVNDAIDNYKFAILLSRLKESSNPDETKLSYYIVLDNTTYINSPLETLLRESYAFPRHRNESMTTVSSSPSYSNDELSYYPRPRINSQLHNTWENERKTELYQKAKKDAEGRLQELVKQAERNHYRDMLIQKLLRPAGQRYNLGLETSYHGFSRDDFNHENLRLLSELDLSFCINLLRKDTPIFRLAQKCSLSRYKNLLFFLKSKINLVTVNDSSDPSSSANKERGDIGIAWVALNKTPIPNNKDKISVVVIKHNYESLDIFAVVKDREEIWDRDHIMFWEKILTLICTSTWERLRRSFSSA